MSSTYIGVSEDISKDWLLQFRQDGRVQWQTMHVYSGNRPRPAWPREQARRLRRLGRLRTIRREDES